MGGSASVVTGPWLELSVHGWEFRPGGPMTGALQYCDTYLQKLHLIPTINIWNKSQASCRGGKQNHLAMHQARCFPGGGLLSENQLADLGSEGKFPIAADSGHLFHLSGGCVKTKKLW